MSLLPRTLSRWRRRSGASAIGPRHPVRLLHLRIPGLRGQWSPSAG